MATTFAAHILGPDDHASRPAAATVPYGAFYYCTDHDLLYINNAGTWGTYLDNSAAGGAVATDAIWDAAGDLAVGSGANTAARLAAGSEGEVLTIASGVPSWEAAAGGSFDPDVHMPRRILILPQVQPPDTTPQGTWVVTAFTNESVTYMFTNANGTSNSVKMLFNTSTAQNDEVTWSVPMSAGTWTIRVYGRKSTNTGIITVEIDGSSVGTTDTYAAAVAQHVGTIAGVSVASTGLKSLGIVIATKNASSSGYNCQVEGIELQRTA